MDASSLLGLVFEDEDPAYAEAVLREVARVGGIAPSIFWYEVRNVLLMGEPRNRIEPAFTIEFLERLDDLPIQLESAPACVEVVAFSRRFSLSAYDAAYLDVASRHGVVLATLDKKLAAAARKLGSVSVFAG